MQAAIALESIPPLNSTPTGTSLTISRLTVDCSTSRRRLANSRQEQLAPLAVPDREREDAVEVGEGIGPELFEQVEDDFGIAMRRERVAALHQKRPQLAVVIDFPVEDDLQRAGLVRNRLVA